MISRDEFPNWWPTDRKPTPDERRALARWDEEQSQIRRQLETKERAAKRSGDFSSIGSFKSALRREIGG